jgi:hypothetical protein
MAARAPTGPQKPKQKETLPLDEQIRQRAHEIYLQRGGQDGSDWDDWLQAEQEVQTAQDEEGKSRMEAME